MNKWDNRFISLAKEVATWSKDPDRKVGAVIVAPERSQFSHGYNGFPVGMEDSEERLNNRETKLDFTVHAELNAILNAPWDIVGSSLYCTKAPCLNCAKAIAQAGIKRVVCPKPNTDSAWFDETMKAFSLLNEVKIKVITYERIND